MNKIFLVLFMILLSSIYLSAQFNIFSEIHLNYMYSTNDDYIQEKGNHNMTLEYAAIDITGQLIRDISGRITYDLVAAELENAYVRFQSLGYSDIKIQVGQQYNIFGLKQREGVGLIVSSTIEQEPENRLSAINSKSLILEYPVINVGSFMVSFQDEGDTLARFYKNYTLKLVADKVMEGVNLSISYQMLYVDILSEYKPQYSIGLGFDLGSAGLSVEHININNEIIADNDDCKLLKIEAFYNYSEKTMLLFEYLKVNDENYDYYDLKLEAQSRVGTSTKLNDNLFLLTEWGRDKYYDSENNNWYKAQLKAYF